MISLALYLAAELITIGCWEHNAEEGHLLLHVQTLVQPPQSAVRAVAQLGHVTLLTHYGTRHIR